MTPLTHPLTGSLAHLPFLAMTVDPWIFTFSLITVVATIGMGFWSAKKSKTASDFFVAGRSVSVGWNASAISGEYLSAASFMGIAGMVMKNGYDALWYPVCYACGYLFLLLFIAGPLRRFGAYTIPDFAEGRYDSPVFRKIAVIFVLFIGFFYTMPQMKGAGTTLAYIFPGLDYRVGVILVGAVITLNVSLGGMKGITLVQAIQYWIKMFAISAPIFVLMAVYGSYGKQLQLNHGGATPVVGSQPAQVIAASVQPFHWDERKPSPDFANLTVGTGSGIDAVKTWLWRITYKLNRHQSVTFSASPVGPCSVEGLLSQCANVTGEHYFLSEELRAASVKFGNATALPGADWVAAFEGALKTNGVGVYRTKERNFATVFCAIVREPQRIVRVLPADRLNDYLAVSAVPASGRRPLPAKAPADDEWLSPFGPLTTKAAKTANASPGWNTSPELRSNLIEWWGQKPPAGLEALGDRWNKFIQNLGPHKAKPAPSSIMANWTNIPPNTGYGADFRMLDGLKELGILSGREFLVATNIPRPSFHVAASSGSFQSRDDIIKYLENLLLTNGVRVDLDGRTIKAMAAGDWERYQQQPASLTFVPNRILSMYITNDSPQALINYYSEAVGKHILIATNLPAHTPEFNEKYESLLPCEVIPRLEKIFAESGITIIPAGHDELWGVPTTDIARYQLPPVNVRGLSLLYTYSLIIALVCGTAGLPHILVRFYTNPDGVAAKKTTMWVMILIGVFYLFPPMFGVLGRNLLPELYSAVGAKGTDKVVLELPSLLNQKIPGLGSILSGITCAGAFAAFMSTFSGLLVSMTGALAHDVYGRILRPRSTPEQRLRAFKICAVIIGVVAILLGMQVEKLDINFMVGQAFAIAAASYFPLLFLSTWWRGMTMKGAACGMLGGGLLALAGISLTSFSDLKLIHLDDVWAAHPLARILCEQPAIWAVPLAIGLMIVVSKLTRREAPADVRMKMLVLHAPEKLGLKQEYIQEHAGH